MLRVKIKQWLFSFTTVWTWKQITNINRNRNLFGEHKSLHPLDNFSLCSESPVQQLIWSSIAMEQSGEVVVNNSNNGVHGATFYNSSGISGSTNLSLEEYLKMALGPQKQEDEVMTITFSHFSILAIMNKWDFPLRFALKCLHWTFKGPKWQFRDNLNP